MIDVQARGKYPNYFLKQLEREGLTLPILEGDEELLAQNTVDFVSFSYYSSRVAKVQEEGDEETSGNIFASVKTLTSKHLNGAGRLILWGYAQP